MLDRTQGATMLTIPVGHTLAGVQEVLGDLQTLSALLATRRPTALIAGTADVLPVTSPDQVLAIGALASGAPLSIHYRGGLPRDGRGLVWDIHGVEGNLRVLGPLGHAQLVPLAIEAGQGADKAYRRLDLPASYRDGFPADSVSGNVARVYAMLADDIARGGHSAPSFHDGVALHHALDAMERSARDGRRVILSEQMGERSPWTRRPVRLEIAAPSEKTYVVGRRSVPTSGSSVSFFRCPTVER